MFGLKLRLLIQRRSATALIVALFALAGLVRASATTTFVDLHDFTTSEGQPPFTALVLGTDGSFYAAAGRGGIQLQPFGTYQGTLFKVSPSGVVSSLHSFTGGPDGALPLYGGLTEGADGNFYGAASQGGPFAFAGGPGLNGTLFKVSGLGAFSLLYGFTDTAGVDGVQPNGGLVLGPDGDFYGTTSYSGPPDPSSAQFFGPGTLFRLTPGGVFTTLDFLTTAEGSIPSSLILGYDGNYYGMTNAGMIKMTPQGTLMLFPSPLGPARGLVQGDDGNFYSSASNGNGAILKITPTGSYTTLHTFTGSDSVGPTPTVGMDGKLYGVMGGGANGTGAIYSLSTDGTFALLYSFPAIQTGTALAGPITPLTQYSDGSFYGSTIGGGTHANGGVYKFTVSGAVPSTNPAPSIGQISPNSAVAGSSTTVITLTGRNFVGGSVVEWNGVPLTTTFDSGTGLKAVVLNSLLASAGSRTVTVVNPTPGGGTSNNATFTISSPGTPVVPSTPTGLKASAQDGYVVLMWNASSGATSYTVYMTAGGTAAPVTGITGNQYVYPNLTDGIYYTFTVAAVNSAGTSAQSAGVSVRPESTVPPTAPVLTATAKVDEIDLSWSGSTGADSYTIVRRAIFPGGSGEPLPIATVYPPQTTYKDTDMTPGWSYDYYIAAINNVHETDSNTVAAAPLIGAATHFVISTPAYATSGSQFSFQVTALDVNNYAAINYSGTVHFTSTDPSASLPVDSSLVNGVGSFNATLNTTGSQTITATDTSTASISGTSPAIAVSGPATHFVVTAPSTASQGVPFSVSVTAYDAGNNVATGYSGTVHFTSSDGAAILPADAALINGTRTFNVTLKTLGAQTLTATDTTTASITGTSGSVTVNLDVATHFSISGPSTATAGVPFNVTVTARDAENLVVATYGGTVHFTSTDGAATLPSDSTLTNGTGTFSVTLNTAGAQTITATDTVTSSIAGTSSGITVFLPATHFSVAAPTTAVTGTSFKVTVTALDQNNNVAASYSGTVHFTSSDGAATLPADSTLTNGTGTFNATLNTIGSQTISATDTVTSSITGVSSSVVVTGPATHLGISAPATVRAGVPFNITVTALDVDNNTAISYAGVVHFTSSDSAAVLPTNSALTNGTGTFSVTLKTGGSQTVTATDITSASITGTSPGITVALATFPAGLQMITVPLTGGTPGTLFNDPGIVLYSYPGTQYATASTVVPGQGYWVKLKALTALLASTNLNPRPTSIGLHQGWNIIGDPFTTAEAAASLKVQVGTGTPVAFIGTQSAVAQVAYTWQVGDTGYESSVGSSINLKPFEGYWVYAYQPCTLIFN